MIKKLYSADPEEEEEDRDKEGGDKNLSKTQRLEDAITRRKLFSYKYMRLWYSNNFSRPWCCCCKFKSKRNDFLFKQAKQKLFTEIDVLEIVKKMRVSMFATDMTLKQRQ